MKDTTGIIAFSTSNYEAMRDFFTALGFEVTEGKDQLLPLFEDMRGSYVQRGDIAFNLEESKDKAKHAQVNLSLFGYSEDDIALVLSKLRYDRKEEGLSGPCYTFRSPDGGIVAIG